MSALDDNIVVEFDTRRVLKQQYIQCKKCKQIKGVEEFVSKRPNKVYNKICRCCLYNNEKYRFKDMN